MRPLLILTLLALVAGCSRPAPEQPLSEWEVADLEAARYDFRAFPGSIYLRDQTELLRRAHFVLHPTASQAPPTVVLSSDAPLEEVAGWYAESYGYRRVAPNSVNDFSSVPPKAYYRSGDLKADAEPAVPLLEALELDADISNAEGEYRAAHIEPTMRLPRVSIQRPWFNALENRVEDSTLIIMVREEADYFAQRPAAE